MGAKDDYGYNQAHAEGAAGIAKIPGVKIVEQASVPETTEVQEAMRSMIEQDGAEAEAANSMADPLMLTSLSLYYPGVWNESISSGQGLMAVALVIFARWEPMQCLYASLLFGGAPGALGSSN
ncbi:hypothetical protein [Limnofasciculus baicalensis]|uniref:Uncharacterized protein n=1 Tax=Limnofasciculus baicalensis BBK-W-15 TaxID=2699891 RepID=A0AAE3GS09_9CYAN|nr:hypothetical protein [Limnofasciculus baicalensis]MCP2728886.1 hypothetical protein [Limnofasciculus baicalensis BBK-W-15]